MQQARVTPNKSKLVFQQFLFRSFRLDRYTMQKHCSKLKRKNALLPFWRLLRLIRTCNLCWPFLAFKIYPAICNLCKVL